jgi:uncharacterized SAM-binding protein YcdF (DUF218 family)
VFLRWVVLDGDNRVGRARQAELVWSVSKPDIIYVMGRDLFAHELLEVGLPRAQVRVVSQPSTTREQMAWILRLQSAQSTKRVALIASRVHMPRVMALANAVGLRLTLIASPLDDDPPISGLWLFLPTPSALRVSRDALYEHAALAYYRWRGWIAM